MQLYSKTYLKIITKECISSKVTLPNPNLHSAITYKETSERQEKLGSHYRDVNQYTAEGLGLLSGPLRWLAFTVSA